MEIWYPSWSHSKTSYLFGSVISTLFEELEIPCEPADPVTLRRQVLQKGAEPDKLFYLRDNAAKVRGKWDLDLNVDPPPDLVLQLDLYPRWVPRLPIFAALGIPEVWLLDDEDLQFLHLQPDGTYQPRDRSLAFPDFLLADAARFLEQSRNMDMPPWFRTFRAFVRETLVPRA
jgi:Uma2 family endonuclease